MEISYLKVTEYLGFKEGKVYILINWNLYPYIRKDINIIS